MIMEDQTLEIHKRSFAATLIFGLVVVFQVASRFLEKLKKDAATIENETQLRTEIKQLTKEANMLSQPSSFVQSAKLKRMAAAKEKELAKLQEIKANAVKMSFDLYLRILFISKVVIYFFLVCWFWRSPVTLVSQHLVQPLGRFLSFRTGGYINNNVMVGIIPWLVLSTRISKLVCRLINLG